MCVCSTLSRRRLENVISCVCLFVSFFRARNAIPLGADLLLHIEKHPSESGGPEMYACMRLSVCVGVCV